MTYSYGRLALAALATFALAYSSQANINLELRLVNPSYKVGDDVNVDLIAVSDSGNQTIGALDVIVKWDPVYLNPISSTSSRARDANGPYSWFQSGFINPAHLNDNLADGDAMWTGLGQFLTPFVATVQGNILTTFKFKAKRATHVNLPTYVRLPAALGGYSTAVYSGDQANLNVTGSLTDLGFPIKLIQVGPNG